MAKPSPSHAGNPTLVALGEVIRCVRIESGISQETLALNAGLDRSYMGGIERGEHNVAIINLNKVAAALDMKLSELLERSGY